VELEPRHADARCRWRETFAVSGKCLLEISVETLESALAAERGGADRIELCGDLSVGGITASAELMLEARANVAIPIFAMIRPRAGDFVYSDDEFTAMRAGLRMAYRLQLDGVVLGILTSENRIDIGRTRELVELARGMQVTYHRAFDEAADLHQALADVIQSGAKRILTSGGAKSALEGAAVLAELIEAAGERIIVVPGAGISATNIEQVAQRTKAREFHSGLSSAIPYGSRDLKKFEEEVRKLAEAAGRLA
jgi:copper homeostasis protein